MNRIGRILIALLLVALASTGCSSGPPPTEPEGGYLAFRSALVSRDADGVWAMLSDETHLLVENSLETLRATNELILQLQPSDQERVREDIGADLLSAIETPKDLFKFVFVQENIPVDDAYLIGLAPQSVSLESEHRALITTKSEQEIEVIRDENGYWRVRNPVHEQFAEAFAVMEENRANVEAAINLYSSAATENLEIARLLGGPADESDDGEEPEEAEGDE